MGQDRIDTGRAAEDDAAEFMEASQSLIDGGPSAQRDRFDLGNFQHLCSERTEFRCHRREAWASASDEQAMSRQRAALEPGNPFAQLNDVADDDEGRNGKVDMLYFLWKGRQCPNNDMLFWSGGGGDIGSGSLR